MLCSGIRLTLCMATQSLVVDGRSFIGISNYAQVMEKMYYDSQGVSIRGHNIKVILVRVVVAHVLEAVVLSAGTLHSSLISIRVNIVGPFMLHFKLPIGAYLFTVIILTKVVIFLL